MPVCEYFDQSGLLSVVIGERPPDEVYRDFRSAVFEILGSQDNQNAMLNGVVGMGKGNSFYSVLLLKTIVKIFQKKSSF